jgi:hypothetical protein
MVAPVGLLEFGFPVIFLERLWLIRFNGCSA